MRAAERRRALEKANRVRVARSKIKLRLRRGEASLLEVLDEPVLAGLTIGDLMAHVRFGGGPPHRAPYSRPRHARARRELLGAGVSETRIVGTLTDAERRRLAEHLEGRERLA